ncbi:MAG: Lipid A export ATP-binding/permease protein MsbA [Candidatus Anoxychlamydiales bacterium]|nr:Lipid A export ATP-binding/permease protein MsbA [Candidatus Anoxychlamydiales bacterium]NGX40570.1 Lipid A export ATP-binding/permease protein MsbA [Candidatus Anoxychlamydiales bacterium]HEU64192.1 ABC transporter ATP-binding protein [Chlamydiota bacterium]
MRLLLKAALKNSRHLSLAMITLVTLQFMSIANQMEMFSLGFIANTGADFFTLFGKDRKRKLHSNDKVSLNDVKEKWDAIDTDKNGVISKKDAAIYIAGRKNSNPLNRIFRIVGNKLNLEGNFKGLIYILVFVALFKAIFLFISRYLTQVLSIRITRDLRQQFFEHIQSLPLSFYQEHNMGSLSTRAVGDASQIASSINSLITNYFQTPFTICAALLACFYLSWKLSLIIFIGMPMIILPVVFLTKRIKKVARQIQKNQESFNSVLLDFLGGIQTIKIFAMEKFTLKKYNEQNMQMAYLESKNAKYTLLTRPVLHLITTSCMATVVMLGLYTLNMSIPVLLVFVASLHLFYEPVKKFAEENSNIQRGIVAAERMFEVISLKPAIQDEDGAIALKCFSDFIEFKNVSFRYQDEWVLKDINFKIKKGETIAIVGPTGAGKSTIVQLLPRLFDVQKGEIIIDGYPLKEYTQKSLRENIAFVPQKPFLFYDSIIENISFGRDFTFEEVKDAAIKAHAHEFIVDLEKNYHTILAERGKTLSGGQQQRLAIARALVKKAPILVMDEATSSLDAISESKIKDAIKGLQSKVTQIIIAHRLSTIEHADRIIYIEKGIKLAEGSKDELLKTCAEFKYMWEHYHRSENLKKTSV